MTSSLILISQHLKWFVVFLSAVIYNISHALPTPLFELECVCWLAGLPLFFFARPSAVDHGSDCHYTCKDTRSNRQSLLKETSTQPGTLYTLPTISNPVPACCLCDQKHRRTSWWLQAKTHKPHYGLATGSSPLLHVTSAAPIRLH